MWIKKPSVEVIPEKEKEISDHIQLGNTVFDYRNQKLQYNGQEQSLTFRENKLLLLFARQPNQVIKREDILEEVWGDEGVIVGRSLDVFISRLRKIIKNDPDLQLKNIHGVGYRLEAGK